MRDGYMRATWIDVRLLRTIQKKNNKIHNYYIIVKLCHYAKSLIKCIDWFQ